MDGIVNTTKQLNKGALSNLGQVVYNIASARNKRAFDDDHNQAQLPSKKVRIY